MGAAPGTAARELAEALAGRSFATILADPPWRFKNRTGKIAPEHHRLRRYSTLSLEELCALPIDQISQATSHLYLWTPNALLPQGLSVMEAWGFEYKANLVWHKVRKDGGSDGRGVGFYFRNVTELLLFGTKGPAARTLGPGRRQVNLLSAVRLEHSRKPHDFYALIEACSRGPFVELFARGGHLGWSSWGDQAAKYEIAWGTYRHNSRALAAD